jgi:hypothetical protein
MNTENMFENYTLENRLGQPVQLSICHKSAQGREYVFVCEVAPYVSSAIAKNAEYFAFQLREIFAIDPRRLEFIELRGSLDLPQVWRWKFEWVGHSPMSQRGEAITSNVQLAQILQLLNLSVQAQSA